MDDLMNRSSHFLQEMAMMTCVGTGLLFILQVGFFGESRTQLGRHNPIGFLPNAWCLGASKKDGRLIPEPFSYSITVDEL